MGVSYIQVNTISGYIYQTNTDFPSTSTGNTDISTATTTDYGVSCATSCTANSACVAFTLTYSTSGYICTFKSAATTSSSGVSFAVYTKIVALDSYVLWSGVDFVGTATSNSDLSSVTTSSASVCQSACTIASTFVGFNFNGTACWLKSMAGDPISGLTNIVFYLKNLPGYSTIYGYDVDYGASIYAYTSASVIACSTVLNVIFKRTRFV